MGRMQLFSSIPPRRRGPVLISVGLSTVVAAQIWPALPVVATIVLIGWGAILTLYASPRTARQDALSIINLTVYATLVCLAVIAQTHRASNSPGGRVELLTLVDHSAAIVLLLSLAAHVCRRVFQPLAQDG